MRLLGVLACVAAADLPEQFRAAKNALEEIARSMRKQTRTQ
jgi:hypothetical protein